MIFKNNKKLIGVTKGNKTISKIYKGNSLYWEANSSVYNPKKLYITGKFTDDSTSSDWFVYNGSNSSSKKINISEFVDPETKEFDVVLNDVKPPYLFYSSKIDRIDKLKYPESTERLDWSFCSCSKLTEINVTDWNIENITDISYCFCGCSNITEINVSNWNVENVKKCSSVFSGCKNLKTLDLSQWNLKNATDVSALFSSSPNLIELKIKDCNIENVTNFSYCFSECSALTELNLANWNVHKATDFSYCFNWCSNLQELDLSNWDVENVTTFKNCFTLCSNLTSIKGPISNIKVSMDLSFSPLTNESAMVLINGLSSEITTTQTIIFKATTYNSLTEEQIALATSKGWSVAK